MANVIDGQSRTCGFYVLLANQWQDYTQDGRQRIIWRFRPGDQVRLSVALERMENVFVLPPAAVARKGPETFVFRQNGDLFDRLSVPVLHEDRASVVIANDGSVRPGAYVAQGSAASLDRVLKARAASGLPANVHVRAKLDEHAAPVNSGEYILSMNSDVGDKRAEIIQLLLDELREEVPGVDFEVEQPLAHLISHMVSGIDAQIAMKVVGDDLDTLLGLAENTKAAIDDAPGLTPPVVEPIQQADQLHIKLDPHALAQCGVTRAYIGKMLQTALQSTVTSQVLEGQRRFDLLIRLEESYLKESYRTDYAHLGRLRLDLPEGRGQVELSRLAQISEGSGSKAVNRENARRRIVVRCQTAGLDLVSAVADIERRIQRRVSLPRGYFIECSGQFESQRLATALILLLGLVSVAGMFAVLLLLLPFIRIVLQIPNAPPTAFSGSVLGLVLTGQAVTVASLVGFVSLAGIAVRNGILLVTHYIHHTSDAARE